MNDDDRLQLEEIQERLDRVEKALGRSQAGGGGIGCLGVFLFVWVLMKLYEILERLPDAQ